jgi:hypothetical protein
VSKTRNTPCLASAGLHPWLFFNKPTEVIACCNKRSASRAHHPIFLTLFRIDDRWRVAHGTSKFLTLTH